MKSFPYNNKSKIARILGFGEVELKQRYHNHTKTFKNARYWKATKK